MKNEMENLVGTNPHTPTYPGAPAFYLRILVMMQTKVYIPSAINIWKKMLTKAILADKNGLISGRLACTSTKTEIFLKMRIHIDFNPEFQVDLECFSTKKTWKVKIITNDLNDDLLFHCTRNQLCVPQIVSV